MDHKNSLKVQKEITTTIERLQFWKNLFFIEIRYYFEGWSIILREKHIYPRIIVIFKHYEKESYSLKSLEIHQNHQQKEKYEELFSIEDIKTQTSLLQELKEVIKGKDLLYSVKQKIGN